MGKLPKGLTEKQKAFCREYIFDWNAARAARDAGYSEETARTIGHELLTKPDIQGYLTEIQKDLEKTAGISRMRIVKEHEKIAFSSIAHLHNTWIDRKEFDQLTDDQKACIQEITTQTRKEFVKTITEPDGIEVQIDYVKIKLYSKQASLESLSKMLGYNEPERIQHTVDSIKGFQIVPASGKRTSGK